MIANLGSRVVWGVGVVLGALSIGAAVTRADVGPPVKISMDRSTIVPAVSGQEYTGTIELWVGEAGVLSDLQVTGVGWTIREVESAEAITVQAGEIVRIPFRAVPADATQKLLINVLWEGRLASRSFALDAKSLERPSPGKLQQNGGVVAGGAARGGAIPLAIRGCIQYMRQDNILVGADGIYFKIMDDDSPSPDETMYEGLTDTQGCFNIAFSWDDCDISGCDDPDVYVVIETNTSVVNVQQDNLFEDEYVWDYEDSLIEDFGGSAIEFGTFVISQNAQAVHIHNSITRAHRFILNHGATNVEELDVLWPFDKPSARYDPSAEEIQIGADREWNEDTHTHEYGHHFIYNYSTPVSPDYCNLTCDCEPDACEDPSDCGHCQWCSENEHDAWAEGWPNWLADVVTRSYSLDYVGTDGQPYQPLNTRSQEMVNPTCTLETGAMVNNHAPWTEGYAGALLRDIEDAPNANDPNAGADAVCDRDALTLGVEEIFELVKTDRPTTIAEFIEDFRLNYQQYDQDLWSTVRDVSTSFSFLPPTPIVVSQTEDCASQVEGEDLQITVQGNGSLLKYQWRKDGVDVEDSVHISGSESPTLHFSPLAAADAGVYRCVVSTCDLTRSVVSLPIRVSVFPGITTGILPFSWGLNTGGQLGQGTMTNPDFAPAAQMTGFADAIAISGGSQHSLAIRSDRTVMAWGGNAYGELGIGTFGNNYATPQAVQDLEDVVAVATGVDHSMALTADGKVWTWGYGGNGALGIGPGAYLENLPVEVPDLDCVVAIDAAEVTSFAVKSDGTVWGWGSSCSGILGPNAPACGIVTQPTPISGATDAVSISCNLYHCVALRSDGTVMTWGSNNSGEAGIGTSSPTTTPSVVPGISSAVAVEAGPQTSMAILADGTARGWGYALSYTYCDQAIVMIANRLTPLPIADLTGIRSIRAGTSHNLFLHTDGSVTACGQNGYGEVVPFRFPGIPYVASVPGLAGVTAIAAGGSQSFALLNGVAPYVREHPTPVTVTAGQRAEFEVVAGGQGPLRYTWQHVGVTNLADGPRISGSTTSLLVIDPVHLSDAGNYRVMVDNQGLVWSMAVTLTVNRLWGDVGGDGDIDWQDAADFEDCLGAPNAAPTPSRAGLTMQLCLTAFNHDGDLDVDEKDFAEFQRRFDGGD